MAAWTAPALDSLDDAPGLVDLSHLRVLVAEDNTINQKVVLRMLQRIGHRADTVADGREALEALHDRHDAMAADLGVPVNRFGLVLSAVNVVGAVSALLAVRMAEELAHAREQQAWNRLSAFVLHDIKNAAALLGHEPGLHQIQGIGDGFVPDVLDVELVDMVFTVSDEEAIETTRRLSREEGLLVGTSSGANVFAALHVDNGRNRVVTILPDRAERYFSTALL